MIWAKRYVWPILCLLWASSAAAQGRPRWALSTPEGHPPSLQLHLNDEILLSFGNTPTAPDYWVFYDADNTRFSIAGTNCDGLGGDCGLAYWSDGTNDLVLVDRLYLGGGGSNEGLSTSGAQTLQLRTDDSARVEVNNTQLIVASGNDLLARGGISSDVADLQVEDNLDVAGTIEHPAIVAITVDAATTFAITRNIHTLDCNGAETINTITGATGPMLLTLILLDADTSCTITDTDDGAANTLDLDANITGADDMVVQLVFDGTLWRQAAPEQANP